MMYLIVPVFFPYFLDPESHYNPIFPNKHLARQGCLIGSCKRPTLGHCSAKLLYSNERQLPTSRSILQANYFLGGR